MASALNTKVRNVQFNVTGFDQIIKYQKHLVDNKKEEIKVEQATLATLTKGTKEYEKQERVVNKLTKEFERMDKELKKFTADSSAVRKTFDNLATAGPGAINKLDNALKRLAKSGITLTNEMKVKLEDLVGKGKNVTGAMVEMFSKGFNFDSMTRGVNKAKATYTELSNYVQIFNKHGRDLALIADNDAKAFERMGRNATGALIEMGKMDGTLQKVDTTMSNNRINEYIQGWQKVAQFSGATAQQVEAANRKIADAQKMLVQKNMNVVQNPTSFAPKEVQEATQWLQKYLDTSKLTKAEQLDVAEAIKKGTQYAKEFGKGSQLQYFTNQFKRLKTLSADALTEQKKYWTDMMNNTAKGTAEWQKYRSNLQAVVSLEEKRALSAAKGAGWKSLNQYNNGAIKQTTTDISAAIESLTKFRGLLNQKTEADTIKQVDNAIRQLNQDLVKAQENVQMAQKYLSVTGNGNAFKGTIADLQKVKAGLEDMRNKLRQAGDAKGIAELDNKILKVEADIRTAGLSAERFTAILKNPKGTSSIKELELAYERLKLEIRQTGLSQKEYIDKSAQLRAVKTRLDELNGSLHKQKGLLGSFGQNLKNIVLHYVGLQMVFMRLINTLKDVVALSDKMTNVQKVTNMTAKEVEYLTSSLQALDTRASTEQLLEFAEQAGKLGVYTERGVGGMQQFVEMAEKISRTLGEDIGGAKAVADLAKLNSILGVDRVALEKTGDAAHVMKTSLDATGSSILNVGNNSAASYAEIVNYVGRLGAIGSTSKMAVTDIVALGGALDALKMPAEAGSTALAQFLAAIQRRTDQMARAAQVDVVEFRKLVNGFTDDLGRTVGPNMMGALQMLLNSVREGKISAQDLMDAMSGRSRTNVNIRNVIQLLAGHVSLLNDELDYAKEGFDSAFQSGRNMSVMEREFARVTDNTAGKFERVGNKFKELFVNPRTERIMGKVADFLKEWADYLSWMYNDANLLESAFARIAPWLTMLWKKNKEWNGEIDYTKDAISESTEALKSETREASNLFAMLRNLNLSGAERKRIIGEINSKYGTMLGFMLNEKSTAYEIANAYRLVCDRLKEKARLEAKETALRRATESANSQIDKATTDINDTLENVFNDPQNQAKANILIQKYAEEFAKKFPQMTNLQIRDKVIAQVAKEMNVPTSAFYQSVADSFLPGHGKPAGYVVDLVQGILNRNKAEDKVMEQIDGMIKADADLSNEDWRKRVAIVVNKVNTFVKSYNKNTKVDQIEEIISAIEGIVTVNDNGEVTRNPNMPKFDKKGQTNKNIVGLSYWLKKLKNDLIDKDPLYGMASTSAELSEMDDAQLNALSNKIKEALMYTRKGTKWSRIGFEDIPGLRDNMTAEQARKVLDSLDEQIKAIGKERHVNYGGTAPGFQHPAEKKSKEPKFEYSDGAIAELDRYYSEREKNIRDMRENEEISEAEMNRRILKNEKEHLIQRSKLRRTFTTDDQAMITAFDAWWASVKELDKLERDKIQAEWKEANDKQIKENNKKAQVDETDRERKANEYRRKINQILENEDEFNKLTNEFKNNLDELDILLSGMVTEDPNVLADTIKQRMAFVFSVMGEAYTLNVTNLKDKITEFGIKDWILSEEEAQLLINRIQTFSDNYDNAIRTSANRIKKTFDMYWKASGNQEMWADAQKKGETANKNNGWLQDVIGGQTFGGRNLKTDSELQLYQLKIAASQAYIDQLEKEMDARIANAEAEGNTDEVKRLVAEREYLISDATTNLNALMEEFSNKQTDISMGLVRNLEPYKDMLVQFADDFGSNVFGKKEDRQKAAQALLTTFVKTLNSMLTQYLIYLATKKMADKVQLGEELTDQGTTTVAKVAANSAEGQSKEVAKHGLAGLATATAITVAMTALTAMILSKINQAKSQLGVGNVGKLGSSMLTYAEGKYIDGDRVVADGNDGKRYNARYTDNIKTGVYHGPHVAVFSEDGDEMVIDHPTLVRTMNQAPWLLKGIQDIHRHGRLTLDYAGLAQGARNLRLLPSRAMRQYADGNVDEILGGGMDMAGASADTLELASTLKGVQQALEYLASNPVHINMYGDSNSLDAKQKKLNGWKKRMGIS